MSDLSGVGSTIVEASSKRLRDRVARLTLFRGVEADLIGELSDKDWCVFGQGDVLTRQGDPVDSLYVIERGHVRVVADGQVLTTRGPDSTLGEQAFIENGRRGATISAIDQVCALRIPYALVVRLLGDRTFTGNLLRALSRKLSEATQTRAIRYRQEDLLRSEFTAHHSPAETQRLLALGSDYGRPRKARGVVLFADIRGFTARSNGMDPLDVARELTAYVNRMVEVVHAHGGMVDKFVGDAVMALWGAMDAEEDGPMVDHAFLCACEMIRVARALTFGGRPIRIGIGLNIGEMFVGNVGGDSKRQFTVLGSTVNLASRYQTKTKEFSASIVVGDAFANCLDADVRRKLSEILDVEIKGFGLQAIYTYSPDESGDLEIEQ